MTTMTFRVEPELKSAFDKVAEARERSPDDLLRDHMQDVVEQDAQFRRQVEDSVRLAEHPSAEWKSHDAVEAFFDEKRAALRARILRTE